MRCLRLIPLLVIFSILFQGCSLSTNEPNLEHGNNIEVEHEVETRVEPVYGGTLRLYSLPVDTFNPILTISSSNIDNMSLIFEPLFKISPSFEPIPWLAESFELLDDSLTLNLRPDVKWHDGTSFSAYDVEYTIKNIQNSESPYFSRVNNIQKITVINNYTIAFTLRWPYLKFVSLLDFPIIKNKSDMEDFKIIGTGPFVLESYKRYEDMNLVLNENWWNGRPFIEGVSIKYLPDYQSVISNLELEEIDVVKASPIEALKYPSISSASYTTNEYNFLGFNFNNGLFHSERLRQSFLYAINREEIVSNVYMGNAAVCDSPINPEYYLNSQNTYKVYIYNPEEAKALLNSLEYTDINSDGILDKDGVNIEINLLFNSDSEEKSQIATLIAQDLRNIGVGVTLDPKPYDEFIRKLEDGDFDIYLATTELSMDFDLSPLYHNGGWLNFGGYLNPEFEEAISSSLNSSNNLEAFQQFFNMELPSLTIYFKKNNILFNKRVKNITPQEKIFNFIEEWFIVD